MLEHEIFGSEIVFVGDDSGLQDELLRCSERVGGGDQIGRKAAAEKVARGTRGKQYGTSDGWKKNASFSQEAYSTFAYWYDLRCHRSSDPRKIPRSA
jgi:hypothetical protein